MRVYESGWQGTSHDHELRVIKAGVLPHRCFTFPSVIKLPGLRQVFSKGSTEAYALAKKHKIGVMMDSGVYSYRMMKMGFTKASQTQIAKLPSDDEFIERYVEFVKNESKYWDFFATVDFAPKAEENYQRHKKIEKFGIRPMPAFHGDESIDYLKRYADLGYNLIGISPGPRNMIRSGQKQVRSYLDAVFSTGAKYNIKFHGFGMTAPWVMLGFPWFSVDSSSWSRFAGYGVIIRFDANTHRLSYFHVSEKNTKHLSLKANAKFMAKIQEEVAQEGYDFELMKSDSVLRHIYNAATMLKIAACADKIHGSRWENLF